MKRRQKLAPSLGTKITARCLLLFRCSGAPPHPTEEVEGWLGV